MLLKSLFLVVIVAAIILEISGMAIDDFETYVRVFNKSYKTPLEATLRKEIFLKNKQFIDEFNSRASGDASFELGINHLSDLSDDEIKVRGGSRKRAPVRRRRGNSIEGSEFHKKFLANLTGAMQDEFDWRTVKDRVTPVRDQGQCGSDWAFAAVGALEGQMAVRPGPGKLIPLSVQNLLDCSINNRACEGGEVDTAWFDIHLEGGIEAETSYPYTGKYLLCAFNKTKSVFNVQEDFEVDRNEDMLKAVVASYGPVAAIMDGSHDSFRHYKRGVYFEPKCRKDRDSLRNTVLVIGYGVDEITGQDYWLLKNSWGAGWGERGYMRLARNRDSHCGITEWAAVPTFDP